MVMADERNGQRFFGPQRVLGIERRFSQLKWTRMKCQELARGREGFGTAYFDEAGFETHGEDQDVWALCTPA